MISEGQFSSVLHKNICCGYSLESPRRGDSNSNEYPIPYYHQIPSSVPLLRIMKTTPTSSNLTM